MSSLRFNSNFDLKLVCRKMYKIGDTVKCLFLIFFFLELEMLEFFHFKKAAEFYFYFSIKTIKLLLTNCSTVWAFNLWQHVENYF